MRNRTCGATWRCTWAGGQVPPSVGRWWPQAMYGIGATIAAIGSDWAAKDIYAQWRISQRWLDEKGILRKTMAECVDGEYQTFDFDSWSDLSLSAHDETIGLKCCSPHAD